MKKLGSRVFRSVSGEPNVVLNFRRSPESEFGFYTRPFHEGARVLARRALQRPGFRDLDALPILFLYRHALELSMKAIILEGNRRMDLHGNSLPQPDLWKVLSGHRLTPLLPHVRRVFKFVGWKWSWNDSQIATFADVQWVLRDLERIDPSSMFKKLRKPISTADFKIVMFNHDAVQANYSPQPQDHEFFVLVTVGSGEARVVPNPALNPDTRQAGGTRLPGAG